MTTATVQQTEQPPIQFTRDLEAFRSLLAKELPRAHASGFVAAFTALVSAMATTQGTRHMICLPSAFPVPFSREEVKASAVWARFAKIAVHAIVLRDSSGAGFFETLCRSTGGGFYPVSHPDEIPTALQRIHLSVQDRYEISFNRSNPEPQDLTLQICSQRGYGEATLTSSPS